MSISPGHLKKVLLTCITPLYTQIHAESVDEYGNMLAASLSEGFHITIRPL